MNTFLLSALCLLGAWAALAGGVTVKGLPSQSFLLHLPLQTWRKNISGAPGSRVLQTLFECHRGWRGGSPRGSGQEILERLEAIAEDPSTCEICAYAACAGC
ncbi:guanylin [Mesoplodon densirostris]|uniref:guanylin n=1 Tax=Mesoplodon densirostris TaxID=48708 RepID=UPI0028DBD277|nr:guanylin [Mesoplodon densirostris]